MITIVIFTNTGSKMNNVVYSYNETKEACETVSKQVVPKFEKKLNNGIAYGTCVFSNFEEKR